MMMLGESVNLSDAVVAEHFLQLDSSSIIVKSEPPESDLIPDVDGSPHIKIEPDIDHEQNYETLVISKTETDFDETIEQPDDSSEASVENPVKSVKNQLTSVVQQPVPSVVQPVTSCVVQGSSVAQTSTVSALPQNSELNLLPVQNGVMMQPNTVVFVVPSNVPNQPYQFIIPNAQNINQIGSQAIGMIPLSNNAISQLPSGTIQQMAPQNVQIANSLIPQTAQNLALPNSFLQQTNQQNLQMAATSLMPQTIPMSGSFMPQLAQNMQMSNSYILQATQQNLQIPNTVVPQVTSMPNNPTTLTSQKNIQMTNSLLPQVTQSIQNNLFSQPQQNITVSNQQITNTNLPQLTQTQTRPNVSVSKTKQPVSKPQKVVRATQTSAPLQSKASSSTLQTNSASKPLKVLRPKAHQEKVLLPKPAQLTNIMPVPQNLLPLSNQQNVQATSTLLPQVPQSMSNNSTSQQNIIVSNPLMSQVSQGLYYQNNVLPLTSQQSFTLAGSLLPQTVQSNNVLTSQNIQLANNLPPQTVQGSSVLPVTSQIISLTSSMSPQTVTSNSALPLTSQQSFTLAGNLLSQTVTSNSTLPLTSHQSFTLAGNLIPQTVTSNSTLPLTSHQSFTLAGNLIPQTVTSNSTLPLTSQQSFTLAGNLIPQTVTSNSTLPLTSHQSFTLAGNLIPQTVTSNSTLPLTSQQSFTLAGNLIPQTDQSNNVLSLIAHNTSLTNNLLPQAVQMNNVLPATSQNISLTSNPSSEALQNFPPSSSSLQTSESVLKSLLQTKLPIERLKKNTLIIKNKVNKVNTSKKSIDKHEKADSPVAERKYLTRGAKRELANKKAEEEIKAKRKLENKRVEDEVKIKEEQLEKGDEVEAKGELEGTRKKAEAKFLSKYVPLLPAPPKESPTQIKLVTIKIENNQETTADKKDEEDNSKNQQQKAEDNQIGNVGQIVNEDESSGSNQASISGPLVVSTLLDKPTLLKHLLNPAQNPAQKKSNSLLECPHCFAELPDEKHLEMHEHIYHNKIYHCACGKKFESRLGLKLHRHRCPLPKAVKDGVVTVNDCLEKLGGGASNCEMMYVKIGGGDQDEQLEENTNEEISFKVESYDSIDEEQPDDGFIEDPESEEMNLKIENVESSAGYPFSVDFSSLDNDFDAEPDKNALTPEVRLEETDSSIDIPEDAPVKTSSNAVKLCKKCKLPFWSFAAHALQCPKKYFRLCIPCGRYFKNEAGYSIHCNRMHNKEKIEFKCDQCSASFRLISELNSHIRTHKDVTVFTCYLCAIPFSSEKVLNTHLNTHFANNTPIAPNPSSKAPKPEVKKLKICPKDCNSFQCNICDRKFRSNNELVSHINIHFLRKRAYNM